MMSHLRRYFISGLLIWLPIWVTLLVVRFLVELMDNSLALLPQAYRPENLFGIHIPGFGVILSLVILLLTGLLVANFLGKALLSFGEKIVQRIPLVRTIYSSVKQVMNTLFSSSGKSFRRVYLVEYPRKGLWSIAFQTGEGFEEAKELIDDKLITLFVPTTPNPTSGFLLIARESEVTELKIPVDEALKMVISLGVMQPKKIQA